MNREKRRDEASVIGRVATLSARASQPVLVWIARQASSQRETTAPSSSWARNLEGTAMRPLSSTECRYSPVNTCQASPATGLLKCRRVVYFGRPVVCFPHFGPLHATSRHHSAWG